MRVGELMQKDVGSCRATDTMNDAARIMWERDCGFVPVVADDGSGRVVGVVTDRDLCMASYTRGKSLHDLRVSEGMSSDVRSCSPNDSLGSAQAEMRNGRVRRLPVLDASGQLLGILSLADIARGFSSLRARGQKGITATDLGELVAAVSSPREIPAVSS
jgi:CBS domain-containing protein